MEKKMQFSDQVITGLVLARPAGRAERNVTYKIESDFQGMTSE